MFENLAFLKEKIILSKTEKLFGLSIYSCLEREITTRGNKVVDIKNHLPGVINALITSFETAPKQEGSRSLSFSKHPFFLASPLYLL